ncbi:unnamed protein product, partial [Mesorhabditis belari]|uniref:Uncharacterized protein n=1 Tax=Mesorhabditis belari TaxID=2138241 RepID=A0AAF3EUP4_9BILA
MEEDKKKIASEINLSGFQYLNDKSTVVRVFWFSVILVFLALTVYQITTQVSRYASSPVSTNVEVEYPEQIIFPVIALCNNNQFRQSNLLGYKLKYDDEISFFEQVIDSIGNASAVEFLRNSTHDIRTMLAGCTLPNGTRCGPEMWTQFWTLNGICWALNLDHVTPIVVTSSGKDHGLRLVLNVESYERADTCGRVLDSQLETGIRVLIYNQTELPITTSKGRSFDAAFEDYLAVYYKKTQIDEDFEKENLALVNIYLQSNAIETWTQQEEYTFWTLACDIGGALGLFLGASVVTITEFGYIIFQQYWLVDRQKKRSQPESLSLK